METVQKLTAAAALEVVADGRQLTEVTKKLLLDKTTADQMAQRARQIILDNKGATRRTVEEITKLLGCQPPLGEKTIATQAIKNK